MIKNTHKALKRKQSHYPDVNHTLPLLITSKGHQVPCTNVQSQSPAEPISRIWLLSKIHFLSTLGSVANPLKIFVTSPCTECSKSLKALDYFICVYISNEKCPKKIGGLGWILLLSRTLASFPHVLPLF